MIHDMHTSQTHPHSAPIMEQITDHIYAIEHSLDTPDTSPSGGSPICTAKISSRRKMKNRLATAVTHQSNLDGAPPNRNTSRPVSNTAKYTPVAHHPCNAPMNKRDDHLIKYVDTRIADQYSHAWRTRTHDADLITAK